jgi:hypothetical protein
MAAVFSFFKSLFIETWHTAWKVLRLIIPVTFVVKAIDLLGFIKVIANFLAPIFELMGLPASFGLVYATTALANLYSGLYVFLNYTSSEQFSTAQVTVIGTMMLVSHSLLIELQVAHRVGARRWFMAGFMLNIILKWGQWLQGSAKILLPKVQAKTSFIWHEWLLAQLESYATIVIIIFFILFIMRVLQVIGVVAWLEKTLKPAVAKIGLGPQIIPLTIIGMLVGLVFGAALIIKEKDENPHIPKKEYIYAMVLLGLCHAIIEDTLLVMSIGASMWGALVFRMPFSFLFTYLFVQFTKNRPGFFNKIQS